MICVSRCWAARTAVRVCGAALTIALTSGTAMAQRAAPPDSEEKITASITPYVWLTGFDGTISVVDRSAAVSAGLADAIRNGNIGACASAEIRAGAAAILLDFSFANLTDAAAIPVGVADLTPVHAEIASARLDAFIGYRIVDSERLALDLIGGVRITHFGPVLKFGPAPSPEVFTATDTWGDAVGGLQIISRPSPAWWLAARGDVGGEVPDEFGSSTSWQLAAQVGRTLSKRTSLVAGYKILHLRRDSNDLHFNGGESGLQVGVRIGGPR
jgi:hypothetical protein